MTDKDNTLDISALVDDEDSVEIDTTGWNETSTSSNGTETTYSYSNDGGDSITLTVDDTIDQTIM